jgi:hypothetical protein
VGDFSGRILAERKRSRDHTPDPPSSSEAAAKQQQAVCVFCWLYKNSQKAILKMKTTKSSVEFFWGTFSIARNFQHYKNYRHISTHGSN